MILWKAVDGEPASGSWFLDFLYYAAAFGGAMTVYFYYEARRTARNRTGPDPFD